MLVQFRSDCTELMHKQADRMGRTGNKGFWEVLCNLHTQQRSQLSAGSQMLYRTGWRRVWVPWHAESWRVDLRNAMSMSAMWETMSGEGGDSSERRWMSVWAHLRDASSAAALALRPPRGPESCQTLTPLYSADFRSERRGCSLCNSDTTTV